jgi:hypothetical protein
MSSKFRFALLSMALLALVLPIGVAIFPNLAPMTVVKTTPTAVLNGSPPPAQTSRPLTDAGQVSTAPYKTDEIALVDSSDETQSDTNLEGTGKSTPPPMPPLPEALLTDLKDGYDCENAPRTPARLTNDLQAIAYASERWSKALHDALAIADAGKSAHVVSALMARCKAFDVRMTGKSEAQKEREEELLAKIEWAKYPDVATQHHFDANLTARLIAAGNIDLLRRRARNGLNAFTAALSTRGDAALRDFRALKLLHAPMTAGDEQGLSLLLTLLRPEIAARAEADAKVLATQMLQSRNLGVSS